MPVVKKKMTKRSKQQLNYINQPLRTSRGSMQALAPRGQGLALGAVRTAPAAVAGVPPMRTLQFYNCTMGANSGLGIRFRLPLFTVCAGVTTGGGLKNVGGSIIVSSPLSPTMAGTLSPQIQRFASCFSRWRWKRLGFIYAPLGSTASGVRLAFAFTNDPLQDQLYAVVGYSGFNVLQTTPVSTVFSPWTGWAMSVPCSSELMYIYPMTSTIGANYRQAHSGLITCVTDSDPGATFTYGTLWWDVDLELYDPAPLASGDIPSSMSSTVKEQKDSPLAEGTDTVVVDGGSLGGPVTVREAAASTRKLPSGLSTSNPAHTPRCL